LAAVTLLAATARLALSLREITALLAAREQAFTDDLTGLPNRRALIAALRGHFIGEGRASGGSPPRGWGRYRAAPLPLGTFSTRAHDAAAPHHGAALLLIDLDRFKEVNDSLGHHIGDELLVQVAARLRASLTHAQWPAQLTLSRPPLLARLGGDEFAILLHATTAGYVRLWTEKESRTGRPGYQPSSGLEDLAVHLAETVVNALSAPFALDDVTLHIDASIGVSATAVPFISSDPADAAVAPAATSRSTASARSAPATTGSSGQTTPTELLQRADVAMYTAKKTRQAVSTYDPRQDPHSRERLQLIEELRDALRARQLTCHYQPIVGARNREPITIEALVRWPHPRRGLLTPDQFLPLAEQAGLMRALTATVLELALTQAALWKIAGHTDLSVAVNLSPTNLIDVDLPQLVHEALLRNRLPAHHLIVEITENLLLANSTTASQVLADLRSQGVATALDDYGTGYSSLAYLQDLDLDHLKLDRSFITPMLANPKAHAIVSSTIDLARHLNLTLVAEGVEDAQTANVLTDLGCNALQGWHVSKPLSPNHTLLWLAEHKGGPSDLRES
jgi:diguanylate cyclase